MWVLLDFKIDQETLLAMKQRAAQMALEAEAAHEAYRKAMLDYWREWAREQIGQLPSNHRPVECEITDQDGTRVVQVYNVRLSHDNKPCLEFREKTKSGKWGKTEFWHYMPCKVSKLQQTPST